jgi:hypothetical protein
MAMVFFAGESAAQKADLAKLRACDLIPGTEVAATAKGKLLSPPLGSGGNCRYTVELPGGEVEAYQITYQPAAGVQAMLAAQSPAEKGEKLPGLWDEAYVGKRFMASGVSVIAVRRADIAVEVSGERREVAVALAKVAVSRVK